MATIGTLLISLKAGTANFDKKMKKSARRIDKFVSSLKRGARRLALFGTAIAAAAVAIGTVLVKSSLKALDATAKLSRSIGISTEALMGLQFAAQISGVDIGNLNKAMAIFVRRLGEAKAGMGTAKLVMDDLGLSASKLVAMKTEDSFALIADTIHKTEAAADKAALAFAFFGRQGVALLPLFEKGAQGVRALIAEAEKLGILFSAEDLARIEQANDAILKTKRAFGGLVDTLTIELAPVIEDIANRMTAWMTQAAKDGKSTSEVIVDGMEAVAKSIDQVLVGVHAARLGWNALQIAAASAIHVMLTPALIKAYLAELGGLSTEVGRNLLAFSKALREGISDDIDEMQAALGRLDGTAIADEFKKIRDAIPDFVPPSKPGRGIDDLKERFTAAEKAANAFRRVVSGLQQQLNVLVLGGAEAGRRKTIFDLRELGITEEKLRGVWDAMMLIEDTRKRQQASLDAAAKVQEKFNSSLSDAQSLFQATLTPLERYGQEILRLNDLLQDGFIGWETYGRAVRMARKELEGIKSVSKVSDFREVSRGLSITGLAGAGIADPQVRQQQLTNKKMDRLIIIAEQQLAKEGLK